MARREQIVCGLDIGTTKICMLVGRDEGTERLEIASTGYAPSDGIKRGVVVDLERAAAAIRKAADEAETRSGVSVDWVTVGISGDHVQSFNCHGAVSIERKNNEVTENDVTQVITAAQSIPIPPGRELIHVLPQEFFLDNRGDIKNPIGLTGARLDANVHVVTCQTALLQNLISAVNRAQMRVRRVVLQQLASAESVLTSDEKELGAGLIDIGGGTTDIALYARDSIRFTSVLPVGGEHFTRDLAVGLRTPIEDAERIKKESGALAIDHIGADEQVKIPGVGARAERAETRRFVCEILHARAAELLELIKDQIDRAGGRNQLVAGLVLTGGGSLLEGLQEMAEQVLGLPVRLGLPQSPLGLTDELSHPVYSTAVGLAIFDGDEQRSSKKRGAKSGASPWLFNRFMSWVIE